MTTNAAENVEWIEVATGQTDHSRIKFRLLVSETVDPADLHSIATLLHRVTIKAEAQKSTGQQPAQPGSGEVCLCHLRSCGVCRYKTDVDKATELRDCIHGLHNRLTAAQQREAELREALRKYGYHKPECDYMQEELPCTCGLLDAIKEPT